ncbi:unnamed protein product [Musa acuminata subsp. burmannicoides]
MGPRASDLHRTLVVTHPALHRSIFLIVAVEQLPPHRDLPRDQRAPSARKAMTCGGSSSIARKEGATPRVRSGSEGRGPHERHLLQRRRGGRAPCRQREGVGQQGRRRRGRCRSRWEQGRR